MISVLQILLKILGIILLSLIGIVIVLLLLVLLVPVRYRFKGYYKEEFVCHGKISWLLHLVSISVDYEKEFITSIKILGIPLSAFQKKKTTDTEADITESSADEKTDSQQKAADNNTKHIASADTKTDSNTNTAKNNAEVSNQTEQADEKQSLIEKIRYNIQNIIRKIQGIIDKIRNLIINIRAKKDTLKHYIHILQREEVKQALSLCKKRILRLIRHVLPKKMKVTARFGFDDPSTTGYVLAVYGMMPAYIGKKIILHPDFENQIIELDYFIKGSVNAWSMLHQLLCIVSDKNCKALYHIVKKEILNERK